MKAYRMKVKYSFDVEFIVHGEDEHDVAEIVKTKVKVLSGSINTFSLQIKDWAMGAKPVESKIIKILLV